MASKLIEQKELIGYNKKSFSIPFGCTEIWIEHLDGMYKNEELVLKKLSHDKTIFCRPSITSLICFNLDETYITENILTEICKVLISTRKQFRKICFVRTNRLIKKKLKKALGGKGFLVEFYNDFEMAKEWLVNNNYK